MYIHKMKSQRCLQLCFYFLKFCLFFCQVFTFSDILSIRYFTAMKKCTLPPGETLLPQDHIDNSLDLWYVKSYKVPIKEVNALQ